MTSSVDKKVDLQRGKKYHTNDFLVIFNSTDFKLDEEIYIKITGYFKHTYIYYVFSDKISELDDPNIEYIKECSNKVVDKDKKLDGYDLKTRYYTIEKTTSNLKGKEGYYLAIYTYMYDFYDIENNKDNEGNSKVLIAGIVVGVVVVIAIVAIIIYCCRKKKLAAMQQNNQGYPLHDVNVYNAKQDNNGTNINNNNAYSNDNFNNQNAYNNNKDNNAKSLSVNNLNII